jgi:hypothetical protein
LCVCEREREKVCIQGRGMTPPLGIQISRMANINQKVETIT